MRCSSELSETNESFSPLKHIATQPYHVMESMKLKDLQPLLAVCHKALLTSTAGWGWPNLTLVYNLLKCDSTEFAVGHDLEIEILGKTYQLELCSVRSHNNGEKKLMTLVPKFCDGEEDNLKDNMGTELSVPKAKYPKYTILLIGNGCNKLVSTLQQMYNSKQRVGPMYSTTSNARSISISKVDFIEEDIRAELSVIDFNGNSLEHQLEFLLPGQYEYLIRDVDFIVFTDGKNECKCANLLMRGKEIIVAPPSVVWKCVLETIRDRIQRKEKIEEANQREER